MKQKTVTNKKYWILFEVYTVQSIMAEVFWIMALCSLIGGQTFWIIKQPPSPGSTTKMWKSLSRVKWTYGTKTHKTLNWTNTHDTNSIKHLGSCAKFWLEFWECQISCQSLTYLSAVLVVSLYLQANVRLVLRNKPALGAPQTFQLHWIS